MWLSRLWTTGDKLVGAIAGLSWIMAGTGAVLTSARGPSAAGAGPLGPTETSLAAVVLVVVPFVLPVAAAVYLGLRLRAHTAAVRGGPAS